MWITINSGTGIDKPDFFSKADLYEDVKEWFVGYEIPDMVYPLRNPKHVVDYAKSADFGDINQLQNYRLPQLKIPSNLVLGPEVIEVANFDDALKEIPALEKALILVKDDCNVLPQIEQSLRNSQRNYLLFSKQAPIDEPAIKSWLNGAKTGDLICYESAASGSENDVIISVGKIANLCMRSTAKLIVVSGPKKDFFKMILHQLHLLRSQSFWNMKKRALLVVLVLGGATGLEQCSGTRFIIIVSVT